MVVATQQFQSLFKAISKFHNSHFIQISNSLCDSREVFLYHIFHICEIIM